MRTRDGRYRGRNTDHARPLQLLEIATFATFLVNFLFVQCFNFKVMFFTVNFLGVNNVQYDFTVKKVTEASGTKLYTAYIFEVYLKTFLGFCLVSETEAQKCFKVYLKI